MSKLEKREHLKEMWRLAFLKAMGASNIKRIFKRLHDRVVTFGTTKNINRTRQDIEKKILEAKPKIVLMPDDPFKRFWSIIMIFLLGYVATLVPYHICFI
jgi:DNA-binding transcriptional ArsR family regulator